MLLVDDHILFREGLSRLLAEEPDLQIAAQCSSSQEALAALRAMPAEERPDLILLDFDLGEENGFLLLEQVQSVHDGGRVLMVTAGMSPEDTLRAIEAGAAGCLLKHAPPGELLAAMRKVMRGEELLSPAALSALRAAAHSAEARRRPELHMSDRERAVLRGVFAGLANKEIAAKLHISEGYVKAVLQQLFAKTGVRTRAQLVRIALEHHVETGSDAAL